MNDESNEVITLQINDKLRILNGDNDSFILQEAYISEKSNTLQWRNKSYYSDILTCLYGNPPENANRAGRYHCNVHRAF